jgi:hypothetical protein
MEGAAKDEAEISLEPEWCDDAAWQCDDSKTSDIEPELEAKKRADRRNPAEVSRAFDGDTAEDLDSGSEFARCKSCELSKKRDREAPDSESPSDA